MDKSTELESLAGLAAQADQVGVVSTPENVPGAAGAPAEAPAEPGPDEQAADAVTLFANLVVSYAPAAADVWTEEARAAAGAAMAPVFEKYGWSLMRMPPELTAAIVVGPLLYKSATVVAEKIKADRLEKVAAARGSTAKGAAPVPGATESGATPATPVHPQVALFNQGGKA